MDFVLIGGLAVGVHAEVRATGDVDVMVPTGDAANKRALEKALDELAAERLSAAQGGIDPAAGDPYPTLMFQTRYGKLDVLYRPDGVDQYAKVKARSIRTSVAGQPIAVAGRDDLVRMKLAAGRPDDLRDVANLTASDHGPPRRISAVLSPATDVDPEWVRDIAAERVSLFDPAGRAWISGGLLKIRASRSDLTDAQIEYWAKALAQRLQAAGALADTDVTLELRGDRP